METKLRLLEMFELNNVNPFNEISDIDSNELKSVQEKRNEH